MIEMLRFRSRILTEDRHDHDTYSAGESVHRFGQNHYCFKYKIYSRPEFNPNHRQHTHQLEVLGNEISLIIPPMAILVSKLDSPLLANFAPRHELDRITGNFIQ